MHAALPALVVAILLAACAREPGPPSVLLIVADTLRADALPCYGGEARAPVLCGLARGGALFEAAYANAPWTPPSSVALLTGMRPGVHAEAPVEERSRFYRVADEHELLAERLRAAGFDVWAYVENELATRGGALQGFAEVEGRASAPLAAAIDLAADERHQRMAGPVERLLAAGTGRFLGLVWTLDPHAPYDPPEHLLAPLRAEAEALPRPYEFYAGLGHKNAPHRLREHAPALAEAELRFVRRLYEAEVTSVDERVGALLAALDARGRRADTLVVFTSDHGEGFGEHGVFLHGKALHEELLRIPLIVAGPGVAPGVRVRAPVSLVDVVPTLCELLGVVCPEGVQGTSLAPLLRGVAGAGAPDAVYAAHPNDAALGVEALFAEGHKLVRLRGGALRLYDLAADPEEARDRAERDPERVGRLEERMAALRGEDDVRRRAQLAPRGEEELRRAAEETEAGLRALGYVE